MEQVLFKGQHQFEGMLEGGYSQRRVANVFGESQSAISRTWNRFQTYGSATQRHSGRRQRATTPREDRFLIIQARRHPFVNATTLRNEFRNAVGVNISTQTVRNCLRQSGLRSRAHTVNLNSFSFTVVLTTIYCLYSFPCLVWRHLHFPKLNNVCHFSGPTVSFLRSPFKFYLCASVLILLNAFVSSAMFNTMGADRRIISNLNCDLTNHHHHYIVRGDILKDCYQKLA